MRFAFGFYFRYTSRTNRKAMMEASFRSLGKKSERRLDPDGYARNSVNEG